MKLLSIIGARPQFIKAGVISRAVEQYNKSNTEKDITEIVLHTGQHFDSNMSGNFLDEFNIKPKYNLDIRESLHGKMTARMLSGIEEILLTEKPDVLMVYGDTNSTLAGALASVKLHIPIAHVEAGLRSFNLKMPEEINRVLTDRMSKWLFCPTETAVNNLREEGIGKKSQNVFLVGDVMFDALLRFRESVKAGQKINSLLSEVGDIYYLATIHRSENTDDHKHLLSIIDALEKISIKTPVVLPLHPRTAKIMKSMNIQLKNIKVIDPVGYSDMVVLLKNCQGVFTDSGGLQKEAYFMNKLCITLRKETEWVELVNNGFNFLVGPSKEKILMAEDCLESVSVDWNLRLYGDGKAGQQIVQEIMNFFN